MISQLLGRSLGSNLESIASLWVAGKQLDLLNIVCSAILWGIWKFRNSMIFNGVFWMSIKQIWWRILKLVRKWKVIFKEHTKLALENFEGQLMKIIRSPLALA